VVAASAAVAVVAAEDNFMGASLKSKRPGQH